MRCCVIANNIVAVLFSHFLFAGNGLLPLFYGLFASLHTYLSNHFYFFTIFFSLSSFCSFTRKDGTHCASEEKGEKGRKWAWYLFARSEIAIYREDQQRSSGAWLIIRLIYGLELQGLHRLGFLYLHLSLPWFFNFNYPNDCIIYGH